MYCKISILKRKSCDIYIKTMSSKIFDKCNLLKTAHSRPRPACCTSCNGFDLGSSGLLSALLRAACYADISTSCKRDAQTQTNILPSSSPVREPRKRKKKKRKVSRDRKKRKRERRRKKYCSSPSYSDYEPENPFLRLRTK